MKERNFIQKYEEFASEDFNRYLQILSKYSSRGLKAKIEKNKHGTNMIVGHVTSQDISPGIIKNFLLDCYDNLEVDGVEWFGDLLSNIPYDILISEGITRIEYYHSASFFSSKETSIRLYTIDEESDKEVCILYINMNYSTKFCNFMCIKSYHPNSCTNSRRFVSFIRSLGFRKPSAIGRGGIYGDTTWYCLRWK